MMKLTLTLMRSFLNPHRLLTCDDNESRQAAERCNVQAHATEALGEAHDGVDPVSEASHTLLAVQYHPVTEDQLVLLRI